MKITTWMFTIIILSGIGCGSPNTISNSTTHNGSIDSEESIITPYVAIQSAAADPSGIAGVFELEVRNTGEQKGFNFLNSEEDYRDQRCLTIRIPPTVVAAFKSKQIDPRVYYKNKKIRVNGTAKRVKVNFISDSGLHSNIYYYQTHIEINQPSQIRVINN